MEILNKKNGLSSCKPPYPLTIGEARRRVLEQNLI
jgi:hypothetical protein